MAFRNFVFICFALIALYFVSRLSGRKRRYLLKNGIPATAKVIDISKTFIEIGTSYTSARPVMKVVLEIERPGAAGTLLTIKQDFDTWEIPNPGDTVDIRMDPRNPDNILIIPPPPTNSASANAVANFLRRLGFTVTKTSK